MRIINRMLDAATLLVTLCGVLFLVLFLLGIKPFIVMSGSMEPEIQTGSLVFVDTRDTENISEGDIIAFESGGNAVTHRVKRVENGNIITKGDANNNTDGEIINQSAVIGKTIHSIPYVGFVVNSLRSPVAIILFALICIIHLVLTAIEYKKGETL